MCKDRLGEKPLEWINDDCLISDSLVRQYPANTTWHMEYPSYLMPRVQRPWDA